MTTQQRFGLIGAKLGHSLSPEIHAKLGDYRYDLIELDENELWKAAPFKASTSRFLIKKPLFPTARCSRPGLRRSAPSIRS